MRHCIDCKFWSPKPTYLDGKQWGGCEYPNIFEFVLGSDNAYSADSTREDFGCVLSEGKD